jgi:hypothetical protein
MRVLCAYTDLHPKTSAALKLYAPEAECVDVSGDRKSYWREIVKRWKGSEDLLLVEHDIEIHGDVMPQFRACDSPWCVFPYLLNPDDDQPMLWGLGCAKFSADVQRKISPTYVNRSGGPLSDWEHLEHKFAKAMQDHGISVCVHQPPVNHDRHIEHPVVHIFAGDAGGGHDT